MKLCSFCYKKKIKKKNQNNIKVKQLFINKVNVKLNEMLH